MGPFDMFPLLVSIRKSHEATFVLIRAFKLHPILVSSMSRCFMPYQVIFSLKRLLTPINIAGERPLLIMNRFYMPLKFVQLQEYLIALWTLMRSL